MSCLQLTNNVHFSLITWGWVVAPAVKQRCADFPDPRHFLHFIKSKEANKESPVLTGWRALSLQSVLGLFWGFLSAGHVPWGNVLEEWGTEARAMNAVSFQCEGAVVLFCEAFCSKSALQKTKTFDWLSYSPVTEAKIQSLSSCSASHLSSLVFLIMIQNPWLGLSQ